MHPIVEVRLPQLRELCRRHPLIRLEVFGSAARGDFDPKRSDLQFYVEIPPEAHAPWAADYQALKADLEALFGRSVDLFERGAIRNPYRREELEATRTLLYAR